MAASCRYRKLPNVREAVIFLLYQGDYSAMKRDGVEVTLPSGASKFHKPRKFRERMYSMVLTEPRLQGYNDTTVNDTTVDVDNITSVLGALCSTAMCMADPFPEFSSLSGQVPAHTSHHIRPLSLQPYAGPPPSPSPHPAATQRSLSHPIYSHVRDFTGLIDSANLPTSPTRPSLMGTRANEYFSAHGYLPGVVRIIETIYNKAADMNAFVDQLSGRGVPITEARYMYALITDN